MNQTQAETIRRETMLLLEAEEEKARYEALETFLEGIAGDIMAKADVTPLWAAMGLYRAAEQIGETIILCGCYSSLRSGCTLPEGSRMSVASERNRI